jgi:hypothetical protein
MNFEVPMNAVVVSRCILIWTRLKPAARLARASHGRKRWNRCSGDYILVSLSLLRYVQMSAAPHAIICTLNVPTEFSSWSVSDAQTTARLGTEQRPARTDIVLNTSM